MPEGPITDWPLRTYGASHTRRSRSAIGAIASVISLIARWTSHALDAIRTICAVATVCAGWTSDPLDALGAIRAVAAVCAGWACDPLNSLGAICAVAAVGPSRALSTSRASRAANARNSLNTLWSMRALVLLDVDEALQRRVPDADHCLLYTSPSPRDS